MKVKKKKKFLSFKAGFLFLALLVVVFFLVVFSEKTKRDSILLDLKSQVSAQQKKFSGNFSLALYSPGFIELDFGYRSDQKIAAASVIKIPILAAALAGTRDQLVTLEQKVTIDSSDVVGGSGLLRRIDLPIELSFEGLLIYMMAISDNTATNKVIDLLGFEYINQIFSELGLNDTILVRKMMDFDMRRAGFENYTSSRDLTFLLKKIYQEKLFSKGLSKEAKRMLSFQQHRDRIPLLLPSEAGVIHKTGLERGVVHDAGIIYGEKRDIILSVLTEDVRDYNQAKKFIAEISYLSYNLLNRK